MLTSHMQTPLQPCSGMLPLYSCLSAQPSSLCLNLVLLFAGKKARDLRNWLTIYSYWNQGGCLLNCPFSLVRFLRAKQSPRKPSCMLPQRQSSGQALPVNDFLKCWPFRLSTSSYRWLADCARP